MGYAVVFSSDRTRGLDMSVWVAVPTGTHKSHIGAGLLRELPFKTQFQLVSTRTRVGSRLEQTGLQLCLKAGESGSVHNTQWNE